MFIKSCRKGGGRLGVRGDWGGGGVEEGEKKKVKGW